MGQQFSHPQDVKLQYFPIRGRAEPLRLALALGGVQYEETLISMAEMKEKAGTEAYPYGQAPLYHEAGKTLAQSDAILRHIGRYTGTYGGDAWVVARCDEVLGGVESLRVKYGQLAYSEHGFTAEAVAAYDALHFAPESVNGKCGGAHFQYLENTLARSPTQWIAGSENPSIADIQVFDLFEIHVRAFKDSNLGKRFPKLAAHQASFKSIPAIAEYMASSKRPAKVNGNDRG